MAAQGLHLTLDLLLKETPTPDQARALVSEAIRLARMTVIVPPKVVQSGNELHVFAVLAESHCALHVEQGDKGSMAYFDLFSCKPFDTAPVWEMMRKMLDGVTLLGWCAFPRNTYWDRAVETRTGTNRAVPGP